MRSFVPGLFAGLLMVTPILASVSSPNYLPFALDKRDCGFTRCDCEKMQCFLDFCFDDRVDPWILVDSAMNQYYGVDCGQFESWKRKEPAEYCNNGLRKGNGLFYINRKFGSLSRAFDVSHNNTKVDDPNRGSVSGSCRPVQDVECKCHSRYNPEKHDCSASCN